MKQMKCFLVVLPIGVGRGLEQGRHVVFKFDDDVHALVMKKMRYMYFDRWGVIRFKVSHMPLLRLLMHPKPTETLACIKGDMFDYRRCNWRAKEHHTGKDWMIHNSKNLRHQDCDERHDVLDAQKAHAPSFHKL